MQNPMSRVEFSNGGLFHRRNIQQMLIRVCISDYLKHIFISRKPLKKKELY